MISKQRVYGLNKCQQTNANFTAVDTEYKKNENTNESNENFSKKFHFLIIRTSHLILLKKRQTWRGGARAVFRGLCDQETKGTGTMGKERKKRVNSDYFFNPILR